MWKYIKQAFGIKDEHIAAVEEQTNKAFETVTAKLEEFANTTATTVESVAKEASAVTKRAVKNAADAVETVASDVKKAVSEADTTEKNAKPAENKDNHVATKSQAIVHDIERAVADTAQKVKKPRAPRKPKTTPNE